MHHKTESYISMNSLPLNCPYGFSNKSDEMIYDHNLKHFDTTLEIHYYDTMIKYAWGPNPRKGLKSGSECGPTGARQSIFGPGCSFLGRSESAETPG